MKEVIEVVGERRYPRFRKPTGNLSYFFHFVLTRFRINRNLVDFMVVKADLWDHLSTFFALTFDFQLGARVDRMGLNRKAMCNDCLPPPGLPFFLYDT